MELGIFVSSYVVRLVLNHQLLNVASFSILNMILFSSFDKETHVLFARYQASVWRQKAVHLFHLGKNAWLNPRPLSQISEMYENWIALRSE